MTKRAAPMLPVRLLLLAMMALPGGCGQPGGAVAAQTDPRAVIRVATGPELAAAVKSAARGSRIQLAPGDYPALFVNGGGAGPLVTISGPREARIGGVTFGTQAQGWALEGVTILNNGPKWSAAVQITQAKRIELRNLLITGVTPAPGPHDEEGTAIRNYGGRAFLLAGSEIRHVRVGLFMRDAIGVVVSGNRFLDLREGINVSNCHGVAIRHNAFQGFQPRYDLGEHPDMIQFWTRDRPTGSSEIEIRGNLFMAGLDQPIQGIFARADEFETGVSPQGFHRNFHIVNNIYFGSSVHGISLTDVHDARVENNTVLAAPHAFVGTQPPDPTGRTSSGYKPAILFRRSSSGLMSGNISSGLEIYADATVVNVNNFFYRPRTPNEGLNPGDSFEGRLTAVDHPPSAFAIRARSAAGRRGQGADPSKVGPGAAQKDLARLAAETVALAAAADRR